jgi:hypothetical protein
MSWYLSLSRAKSPSSLDTIAGKRIQSPKPKLGPEAKGDIQAQDERPRANAGTKNHLGTEFDRIIIGLKVSHQAG